MKPNRTWKISFDLVNQYLTLINQEIKVYFSRVKTKKENVPIILREYYPNTQAWYRKSPKINTISNHFW